MINKQILSGPIVPILLKLAIPIFTGMIIQLVYNITDTLWLSRIDMNDPGIVGGTGLIFPVMFLAIALANGLQTGISALTARSIGKNDREQLQIIPQNGLVLAFILAVTVITVTLFNSEKIMRFMGAEGSFFTHGLAYFRMIIPAAVAMFIASVFNGILQGEGEMKPVMVAMLIGTIGNLILDPLLIFPLNMGVRGAALATVIAQLIALTYSIRYYKRKHRTTCITPNFKEINTATIKSILSIGIPQVLTLALMAISTFVLNKLMVSIDGTAMTAFSLCNRFDSLQFIPILALSSALVTAVGQNYGSGNFRRIRRIWRTSLILAGFTELLLALLLIVLAPYIFPFFSHVESVVAYAVEQTRTVNIFYTAAVFGILARSVFQGINNPLPALLLTTLRLIIISLPLALLFVKVFHWGVHGVWYAIITGSITAGFASFFWTESVLGGKIRELGQ